MSRRCVCRRYTIRGVPGRLVDVIVDFRILEDAVDERDLIAVETRRKAGKFDGAERDRLALRVWQGSTKPHPAEGRLQIKASHERVSVSLWHAGTAASEPVWLREYPRMRADLAGYDLRRIPLWHASRYYQFLIADYPALEAAAMAWPIEWAEEVTGVRVADPASAGRVLELAGKTLAEANRSASRMLYRMAVDAGWRKLPLRLREKLGLGRGQWHHESEVLEAELGDASGVGEATRRAARANADGLAAAQPTGVRL